MKERALLCMVKTNVHDHHLYKIQLDELKRLAIAAGYEIAGKIVQVRKKEAVDYCVGKGKLKEIKEIVKNRNVDVVIFYNILSSSQKHRLQLALKTRVIDRYELTLEIFASSASDLLSKLQITLAELVKLAPLIKLEASMKYKKHRPGFKAFGEYAYHSKIRAIHKRMKNIKKKIERIQRSKELEIERRINKGGKIVCITGYYNAGKTSLFNLLTGLNKPVSDQPFTTLSSKYSSLMNNRIGRIYLVDTIGFVLDLDPNLIKSFQLNLLDITRSHLLLVMFDISDKPLVLKEKVNFTLNLLRSLDIEDDKMLIVLNKIDKLDDDKIQKRLYEIKPVIKNLDYILISVTKKLNIEKLISEIQRKILMQQLEREI